MITNKTRKTVLCDTYEKADSMWKKAKGLSWRENLPSNKGMLFTFKRTIKPSMWMFGMRFPIDILFLDHDKKVKCVVENARPLGLSWRTWRVYSPECPSRYVLELNAGRIKQTKTSVGDHLEF